MGVEHVLRFLFGVFKSSTSSTDIGGMGETDRVDLGESSLTTLHLDLHVENKDRFLLGGYDALSSSLSEVGCAESSSSLLLSVTAPLVMGASTTTCWCCNAAMNNKEEATSSSSLRRFIVDAVMVVDESERMLDLMNIVNYGMKDASIEELCRNRY